MNVTQAYVSKIENQEKCYSPNDAENGKGNCAEIITLLEEYVSAISQRDLPRPSNNYRSQDHFA